METNSIHRYEMTAAGPGGQTLPFAKAVRAGDFVYVSDVVEANMRASSAPEAAGKAYNVATGSTVTINELLETICRLEDQTFNPSYQPAREGDIRHSCADISCIARDLDWRPQVGFEEGLKKLLAETDLS